MVNSVAWQLIGYYSKNKDFVREKKTQIVPLLKKIKLFLVILLLIMLNFLFWNYVTYILYIIQLCKYNKEWKCLLRENCKEKK